MEKKTSFTIVPAQPGWFFIEIIDSATVDMYLNDAVVLSPVIGWRVDPAHPELGAEPVGVESHNPRYALLAPSSVVIRPEESQWKSLQDYVKDEIAAKAQC